MNDNLKSKLRVIDPYVPGEQPNFKDMIKLNTNENPYPPSPKVADVLKNADESSQRLYPDPTSSALVKSIADAYGLTPQNVFVGIGSDDVLALAFMAYFNSDLPVIFPKITYSFYEVWANLFKVPFETFDLEDDFSVNPENFMNKPNGGLLIANPNAPTGVSMSKEQIREIVQKNQDSVVIIDEAYVDFAKESMISLTGEFDNVLVVQTFSKSRSMAGMRIGFAIGNEKLIQVLNDVRYSFNSYPLTRISIETGAAAFSDREYFEKCVEKIKETREWTKAELTKLGFTFPDSETNFIFATHKEKKAKDIFEKLREKHIFVRYFNTPGIDNYLRITIGTDEQMQKFVDELKVIVGEYI